MDSKQLIAMFREQEREAFKSLDKAIAEINVGVKKYKESLQVRGVKIVDSQRHERYQRIGHISLGLALLCTLLSGVLGRNEFLFFAGVGIALSLLLYCRPDDARPIKRPILSIKVSHEIQPVDGGRIYLDMADDEFYLVFENETDSDLFRLSQPEMIKP